MAWVSDSVQRRSICRRCYTSNAVAIVRPRRSFHCRSTLPCDSLRAAGALVMLVAVQLSVPGSYLPPVFRSVETPTPPQTIISLPVHTAVCASRPSGALVMLVAVQLSVLGLYLPPVFKAAPPHLRPRQSFRCRSRLLCDQLSGIGRVGGAGGCPTVGAGIVSPAGVQIASCHPSAPDDHFTAGPHCCVPVSGRGRVGGAGGCPTVGAGIVSSAGVQKVPPSSAPDDHFTAGPHCRVIRIGQRARWWCWWLSNYRCWDCISRRCSKSMPLSAPDDHFTAGPHCCVPVSGRGRVGGAGGCPTVRAGIVSPAGVQKLPLSSPPQTIISLPVQTAVCTSRAEGALVVWLESTYHRCSHPRD